MICGGDVEQAAAILREGGLVVMPTETVYGLACDATNPAAIAKVYQAKGRPRFNPLIAHVPGLAEAERHGVLHANACALAERFWPGPLTLVAERRAGSAIADLACAGLSSVALRAPAHPMARDLMRAFGGPIAAPSANRSGHVSATTAQHAIADLGGQGVDYVLDGGPCEHGLESTILAVSGAGEVSLLRAGAIPRPALEAVVGALSTPAHAHIVAPGMLESHYAPRARLRLDADAPQAGEAYLGFGASAGGLNLSPQGDLVEAAANLYAYLRQLDASGVSGIAVAPIPAHGLGEAIRDRLARAAAPR